MATDKTIRDALQDVMAVAIRANDDYRLSDEDVARATARLTGLRRAVWATLTARIQLRLIRAAINQAKSGPVN